ncbi:hypothetical protein QBC40DRAFT_300787 [Triangularia verruculosa]|uniref:Uncharacterized protein n=1 Tax=Triangularia verruculosa TaxID=2587418 RepID=A0AAN7ARK0_9PEZI|nr:hypothetical protein QBC40DRAFT_300787 [Triangularia verruculosa]
MSQRTTRARERELSSSWRAQAQELSWSINVSPGVPTVLPIPALGVEVLVSPLKGWGHSQRPFTFHLTASPSTAPSQRAEPVSRFHRERSRSPTRDHRQDFRHWRDRSPPDGLSQGPQQLGRMPTTGPNNHQSHPSDDPSGTASSDFARLPPTAPRSMRGHPDQLPDNPKAKINNLKLALDEDQKCLENLKRNVRNYGPYLLKKKTDECLTRIELHQEKLRELDAITMPTFEGVSPAKARHMPGNPVLHQAGSSNPLSGNSHSKNYRITNRQMASNHEQMLGSSPISKELEAITKPTPEAVFPAKARHMLLNPLKANPSSGNPSSGNYRTTNRQPVLGNPQLSNDNFGNGNALDVGGQKVDDDRHTNDTGDDTAITEKPKSPVHPFQEDPEVFARKYKMLVEMGRREEEYIRRSKERGY